jgi:hypothetical protein
VTPESGMQPTQTLDLAYTYLAIAMVAAAAMAAAGWAVARRIRRRWFR